jgi:polysaccharide transporter, PST family
LASEAQPRVPAQGQMSTDARRAPTLDPPAGGARGAALRNMLWLGSDKVLAVIVGLLVFGLIARAYGPVGAGQFSYGAAVLQAALGLSLVCSSAALMPRLCRLHDGVAARAVGNVFVVRLLASIAAALAVALYLVWAIDDPARRTVALWMVAAVPLLEPFHVFSAYWSSRNRNRAPVLARAAGLLTRLAVVVLALQAGAAPWWVALAWLIEALVTASMQALGMRGVRPLRALRASVTTLRARRYLAFAMRFALGLWLSQLFLRLDRLWLAERMDAQAFGLYATAMQLVEVWMQVAALLAGSIAPAYLYRAVRRSARWRDNGRTLALLAGIGLAGLAGAAVLGAWLLGTVFGPAFAASHVYLVAGCAAAVLFFVDQFAQIVITANDRPGLLALKWGAACAVALATLALGAPRIGALAGPLGIALGLIAGWAALALAGRGKGPAR